VPPNAKAERLGEKGVGDAPRSICRRDASEGASRVQPTGKTKAVEQPISSHQVVQKLGCWLDASHQQMVAGAGARHVEQVSFAVVDFFQIGIVRDILDALLRGNDLVVACHDGDERW
jgi:hypothetical protein